MQENNRIGPVVSLGMVLSIVGAFCLSLKAAGIVLLLWASLFLIYGTGLALHSDNKRPSAHTEN